MPDRAYVDSSFASLSGNMETLQRNFQGILGQVQYCEERVKTLPQLIASVKTKEAQDGNISKQNDLDFKRYLTVLDRVVHEQGKELVALNTSMRAEKQSRLESYRSLKDNNRRQMKDKISWRFVTGDVTYSL